MAAPLEIERKFLLKNDAWRGEVASSQRLTQGYLTPSPGLADENLPLNASVRVRSDGERAFINIKSMTLGVSRDEFEYPIPQADAEHMLAGLCSGPVIDKIRHHVHHAGMLWEIDEFLGENAGLVVAEVELESEDQYFERPEWLGDEVSDDPRYYNVSLVRHPYKDWS